MSAHTFADRTALEAFIDADAGLSTLRDRARETLDDDPGHDLAHCLRVALWTLRVAEAPLDVREAIAAALLHDIINVPKNHPDRARASEFSADEARRLMPAAGFEPEAIERVADAIITHSFSRGETPRSDLGRALQDADRLEALGVIGIFRCISTGVRMGATYFDADDPWARHRPLDDRAYSVDHLFTKLLKLPETLTTPAGRAEAHRRAAFLHTLVDHLGEELGSPR